MKIPTHNELSIYDVLAVTQLDPDQIITSTNGSVATKFTFESPVYLEGGTEYALTLLSSRKSDLPRYLYLQF